MNSKDKDCQQFILGNNTLPQLETCVHLGITHNKNRNKTLSTHVQSNIEKARRTLYSLMKAGFHGKNGLNPSTPTTSICTSNSDIWFRNPSSIQKRAACNRNILLKNLETSTINTKYNARSSTIHLSWNKSSRKQHSQDSLRDVCFYMQIRGFNRKRNSREAIMHQRY
ncbi:unnamed protein product [Mytilus coruscus]|uniref:Uncharacterized protein n=1 Tax=Mytilus coruscus TaxID=42192 RepID=A0A6J8AV30_MYTCO|nr:unnamed protein product [Mytilus coruscus]